MLSDTHGRLIEYLRLSLTGACAMRCSYCRPTGHRHRHDDALLTVDEIETLVRHLVEQHSLRKARLTGGEPTARPDLLQIIRRLAAIDCLHELAMTTNGLTLSRDAGALAEAGLQRVNVSLDSLDRDRFTAMTGIDGLNRVLTGIESARAAGLTPIKLNCVVLRGDNDVDLPDLVRFAADNDLEIRFIELMPMGPLAASWKQRYVSKARMCKILDGVVERWIPTPRGPASARRYRARLADGRDATIGFITPMSCSFCALCNRIRITANGDLYPCLMDTAASNLLPGLRPRFQPDTLDQLLPGSLQRKAMEHPVSGAGVMTQIGG